MTEPDAESAKVHEPKIWGQLRASLKDKSGDGDITLQCEREWGKLPQDDEAFRHCLAGSDAYAVFFIRALIGNSDQLGVVFRNKDVKISEMSKIVVIPSALVRHLTNTTDEAFIGADLVARVALTVAKRISKTCGNNFTPRLDCYERPSEVTKWKDLRFLSADFVVAEVKERRGISSLGNSGKNGGACCPNHYYHFGWEGSRPPKDWINHGWRMASEREFANNPNLSCTTMNKIETFLGFPAFFKHDEANIIFALPPVNGKAPVKTPSGCSSHETLFNLGIERYVKAKQREYTKRSSGASAPNGCIVSCLGISDQRAAYFDPDRFKNAYAIFLTIDLECGEPSDALDLQAIIDDLKNSRYQIKYKTLQVLTGKLLSDVENYLELEKRHGRILAQIQQPLQSIVESLIGAQASVQRVNATLFAPQVSLFSVAPVVAKYFNNREWVSFGDFSWESAHSETSIKVPQARNTIAAIVLHALGAKEGGISSAEDLYGRMIGELARDSTGGDPRDSLRKVCKGFIGETTTAGLTKLFFSEGVHQTKLEATLQQIFRRFKRVVFTPFKPDAFEWPVLPLVLLAFERPESSTLSIKIGSSAPSQIRSLNEFFNLESSFAGHEDRRTDDLLYAFFDPDNLSKPPPVFPTVLYSHVLDFLRGILGHEEAKPLTSLEVNINSSNCVARVIMRFECYCTYLSKQRIQGVFESMKTIVNERLGAGTRGDFARPYLLLAERCVGQGIQATVIENSIRIENCDKSQGGARSRGQLALTYGKDFLCIQLSLAED